MMVSPLLALALMQAQVAVPTPGTLPRQQLPERGCAAYLWTVQDQRFVAMVEPTRLRLSLDGKVIDLAATEAAGGGALGLASSTRYAGNGVSATVTMTIAQRETLQDGAIVSDASLSIARTGQDEIIVPVGGLVGCAPTPR
ncbi:hypothetical protein NZL82_11110 [Sphingomonas sanguinis]|uniref:hypothetical protein n=1 Tax=Sphingomonas sp. LC-1 TaxID=3110957 RepID=UPI0021BBB3FF|nr:hypothetical protein [Sphingomonas sp. LC-1]MCT8002425.1 hypothetical protein [Sphingomonas sp. LC-1]